MKTRPGGRRTVTAGQLLRRTGAALLTAALLVAAGTGSSAPVLAGQADEVPVDTGALVWGFKQSWRNYTGGDHEMSGGATRDTAGIMTFPLAGGGYDPVDRVTRLEFAGTVHFDAHPEGDIHLLDLTMSDPWLTISRDVQVLSMEVVSRSFLPPHEFVNFGRVDLAILNITDVLPAVEGGTTSWSDIPTNIAAFAATEVFGAYTPGQALDALSFSYEGPGGAPDFSERWDPPGSVDVAPVANVMIDAADLQDGASYDVFYADQQHEIVYDLISETIGFLPPATIMVRQSLRVFDLATMELLGRIPVYTGDLMTSLHSSGPSFVDGTGRLFLRRLDGTVTSWIRWDPASQEYVTGAASVPFPPDFTTAVWDPVGERAVNIQFTGDREARAWSLHTYVEGAGGTWYEQASYPLPAGPDGLNESWYRGDVSPTSHTAVMAADGSMIVTRDSMTAAAGGSTPETVSALRLVIRDTGVQVSDVPGTAMPNILNGTYAQVYAGPAGQITLVRRGFPLGQISSAVQNVRVPADGSAVQPRGERADLGTMTLDGVSIDPSDGTVWLRGGETRSLAAVRDGAVIFQDVFDYLNRLHSTVLVGHDHRVYSQTFDPEAVDFGVQTFGWASFDPFGASPAVTGQPADALVVLPSGEGSANATFAAVAAGDPAPAARWQVRPAGAASFADIEGETGTTLVVTATVAANGADYRAVFSNSIGAIATEPATLTVHYPPSITVHPAAVAVDAGEPALFQVLATGSPEPTVIWERLDGGSWVEIPGAVGPIYTIDETTVDMSGSQLRARVENPVATVFSDPAALMVNGTGEPPGEGEQQLTVSVPDVAGEFVWQIAGTDRTVALGTAVDGGDHWHADGDLLPITVADTRAGGPAWSISGQVSDFTGGIAGQYLGWSPAVLAPGAGAMAGPVVAPGWPAGPGLSGSAILAGAQAGHEPGTATIGAGLAVRLPGTTPAGDYTAILTITAIG